MILTILKYFAIAIAIALVFAFIIFIGAMLAAVMVIVAEESEKRPKEELTDGDNEA